MEKLNNAKENTTSLQTEEDTTSLQTEEDTTSSRTEKNTSKRSQSQRESEKRYESLKKRPKKAFTLRLTDDVIQKYQELDIMGSHNYKMNFLIEYYQNNHNKIPPSESDDSIQKDSTTVDENINEEIENISLDENNTSSMNNDIQKDNTTVDDNINENLSPNENNHTIHVSLTEDDDSDITEDDDSDITEDDDSDMTEDDFDLDMH